MTTDGRIETDMQALAERTRRALPTLDQTAQVLEKGTGATTSTNASRRRGRSFLLKPIFIGACALAGLLVVPVPYSRTVGYDLSVHRVDGRNVTVHLPRVSAAHAERRARDLREHGAEVTITQRTERVWGSVYAMAKDKFIDVDMDGKTDAQVEAEIAAQVEADGWTPSVVSVQHDDQGTTVHVGASDGAGRHIGLVRKAGGSRVEIASPDLDDTREPGMTDDQLRDKILAQLHARGLDGVVIVNGGQIEVRAKPTAPQNPPEK